MTNQVNRYPSSSKKGISLGKKCWWTCLVRKISCSQWECWECIHALSNYFLFEKAKGQKNFLFFSLFSILCFYHVPKMFSNIFPKMFPIAPWFYPILFAQSSTPMYINWKGGLWGNTFVSILQLGSQEVLPSKGIMPQCSKKIDDGPMNKGLPKNK